VPGPSMVSLISDTPTLPISPGVTIFLVTDWLSPAISKASSTFVFAPETLIDPVIAANKLLG